MANEYAGTYAVVRCRDAGVHAGVIEWHHDRECSVTDARRLWYWKCAKGDFLNGVALYGLHPDSKVSEPVARILMAEFCEIIPCSPVSEASIRGIKTHVGR